MINPYPIVYAYFSPYNPCSFLQMTISLFNIAGAHMEMPKIPEPVRRSSFTRRTARKIAGNLDDILNGKRKRASRPLTIHRRKIRNTESNSIFRKKSTSLQGTVKTVSISADRLWQLTLT